MQKKKNIRLFLLFAALLAWTIIFLNLGEKRKRVDVQEDLFAVNDTSSLTTITIERPDGTIILDREYGRWRVNDAWDVDPSMKKVLMAVLNQVRVKRTVPNNRREEIISDLQTKGARIILGFDNREGIEYLAGGNGISLSYFMYPDGDPYIVYLPGYESYVSGIFDVSENDWRDRLVFQTSWLGLKSLSIEYPLRPAENVYIEPEDELYRVEHITRLDTTAMMNFIDQVSYFYTDQYIDHGQIPAYDSLATTRPHMIFEVDALSLQTPIEIRFYEPLPNENVRLGVINDEQFCLFRTRRIAHVFKTRKDFTRP